MPSLLSKRFQIINLWRPIHHYAIESPLALCDFRSLGHGFSDGVKRGEEGDLVKSTLRYPDRDGETYQVKWNGEHKWKYLRGMDVDEGVLIKWFAPFEF